MFRKFIWQSSRSRIAITELQKDIPDGGLWLTNLDFLNKAIKLSWIKRTLCENNDFQIYSNEFDRARIEKPLGTGL